MIRAVLDGHVRAALRSHRQHHLGDGEDTARRRWVSRPARGRGSPPCRKALSRDVAHANVTINNLLPERIDTARQRGMAELHAKLGGISIEQAYDAMKASIAAGRLGRPEEFGDACAFLCSAQAGFISGQNLQLDGGSYAGLI